jgi:predicted nuclease of predicted toxin-antitoxin system
MKVLLDECLPKRLSRELAGHEAVTVFMMGWAGVKNGKLLELIAAHFDVFVTIDGGLEDQQRLENPPFGIIVLHAPTNKIEDPRPLAPEILRVLARIRHGELAHVPALEADARSGSAGVV